MKTMLKCFPLFIFIICLILGCASNKPNPGAESDASKTGEDVENLYGIVGEDETTEQSSDEEEVLRLLGLRKDEGTEGTINKTKTSDVAETPATQISDLESKLSEKELEIERLKSSLTAKDNKISELESGAFGGKSTLSYSPRGNFAEDYQYALSEYNSRNYKNAISIFEKLLASDQNNSLSDNCQYWIGEAYYGLGNYNQAVIEFTKVFSFNKSNKFDDAQLKLGLCYMKSGDKQKAREELERLISAYPDSEYIPTAESYLSRL